MSSANGLSLAQLVDVAARGIDEPIRVALSDHFDQVEPAKLGDEDHKHLRTLLETISHDKTVHSITLYYRLLRRYRPNSLTPVHQYIVRQCCALRNYDAALPLLSEHIQFMPKEHQLTYHDHLIYHFYGSLCFAALHKYRRASFLLSLILAAGGRGTSLIQLEAYRKYILLGLIENGAMPQFPRTTSQGTRNSLEMLAAPYCELARAYSTNQGELQQILAKHSEQFTRDGNIGLVNLAFQRIASHKIITLSKVYISISLKELAEQIGVAEDTTEQILLTMKEEGRIDSVVNGDRFVVFPNKPVSPEQQLEQLRATYSRAAILKERMASLHYTLELDPGFVAKHSGGASQYGGEGRPNMGKSHILNQASLGHSRDSDSGM